MKNLNLEIFEGGEANYRDKFRKWLKSLPMELTEEEIDHILKIYRMHWLSQLKD